MFSQPWAVPWDGDPEGESVMGFGFASCQVPPASEKEDGRPQLSPGTRLALPPLGALSVVPYG